MNEQLAIYLWSISGNVKDFLLAASCIFIVTSVMVIPISMDFEWDKIKTRLFKFIAVGLLGTMLTMLIPSKQDLALIFLYPKLKQGTIDMVQSDTTKKMKTVLDSYLDKQIKELKTND